MKFLDALALLFIALKLTGQIDWHWALVTLPATAPTVIAVTLALIKRLKK